MLGPGLLGWLRGRRQSVPLESMHGRCATLEGPCSATEDKGLCLGPEVRAFQGFLSSPAGQLASKPSQNCPAAAGWPDAPPGASGPEPRPQARCGWQCSLGLGTNTTGILKIKGLETVAWLGQPELGRGQTGTMGGCRALGLATRAAGPGWPRVHLLSGTALLRGNEGGRL